MAHDHLHRDADLELGELDAVPNTAARRIALSAEEALLRNLLRIRQLGEERLLQLAEEEWGKKAKLFGERVEGKQKQVLNVRNEIYQLVGFFSAFQGLLLTATAQSNMLRCNNQWCPLALSIFASLVTVAGVLQKNRTIQDLQETINQENPTRQGYLRRVQVLQKAGMDFDFNKITVIEERKKKPFPTKREILYNMIVSYKTLIVICLAIFGTLSAVSMHQILCNQT